MSERKRTNPLGVKPFWNRFPAFFLYPFKLYSIIVLFALAFLNGFLLNIAAGGFTGLIFAGLLGLIAGLFSLKYGYDILLKTAHGDLEPPELNGETFSQGYDLPLKQFVVFIVIGFVMVGLMFAWMPLVFVFMVVFVALMPAIIMTLALEQSIAAALNPRELGNMAFRIGWPYFAVLGLIVLLNGGAGTVMSFFGQGLPPGAFMFLNGFVQNYFWFVIMHLMGYLLLQYHGRIGFEPAYLQEEDDGWGGLLDPVHEHIDNGHYDAAAELLGGLMRQHPEHEIPLRQRRHQVLKLTDSESALIQNAGTLMAMLIDANRLREATDVYIDITDTDPELRPARESDYEPLMNMLVQRGEHRRAVRMASGFHKAFPDSDAIPPLYLEVARVMSESLQQPVKARQILDFLVKKFPDHPVAARAESLRAVLTN
ncbi:MAG: DUF4013 domain-containing protein [Halofilum sp. (in: g-proteobacteria)]|nr:DUF4013 domain-containing protein [Halofilum sp. (in: g-proteobacteria)]